VRNRAVKGKRFHASAFWIGGWPVSYSCRGRLIRWINKHTVVWQPLPVYWLVTGVPKRRLKAPVTIIIG
jgi:hypothetical protein